MAASQQGSAVDNIGALYRAFDSYPWQKDQVFTVSNTFSPTSYSFLEAIDIQ